MFKIKARPWSDDHSINVIAISNDKSEENCTGNNWKRVKGLSYERHHLWFVVLFLFKSFFWRRFLGFIMSVCLLDERYRRGISNSINCRDSVLAFYLIRFILYQYRAIRLALCPYFSRCYLSRKGLPPMLYRAKGYLIFDPLARNFVRRRAHCQFNSASSSQGMQIRCENNVKPIGTRLAHQANCLTHIINLVICYSKIVFFFPVFTSSSSFLFL